MKNIRVFTDKNKFINARKTFTNPHIFLYNSSEVLNEKTLCVGEFVKTYTGGTSN